LSWFIKSKARILVISCFVEKSKPAIIFEGGGWDKAFAKKKIWEAKKRGNKEIFCKLVKDN